MSLKNTKKASIFNIFLKNHAKISCLVPVLISLRKPKKNSKNSTSLILHRYGPKKLTFFGPYRCRIKLS